MYFDTFFPLLYTYIFYSIGGCNVGDEGGGDYSGVDGSGDDGGVMGLVMVVIVVMVDSNQ